MSTPVAREMVEILLIIQYALLRESLGRLLATGLGFKIAGQCASVHHGLDVLKQQHVDVALLDLDFGKQPALQFLETAKQRGVAGKILLLANHVHQDDLADFIRNGACGIFQKSDPAALLAHGIHDVLAGNVWFKQEHLQSAFDSEVNGVSHNRARFTQRERLVLSLVAEGLTNREIGLKIGISEGSVKAALQQLFSKFGVRSRSRLVRIVWEQSKRGL